MRGVKGDDPHRGRRKAVSRKGARDAKRFQRLVWFQPRISFLAGVVPLREKVFDGLGEEILLCGRRAR